MDFSEENVICRFCLKKSTENCEPIEEIVQYTLNFLNFSPNLTISDDPRMCETCALSLKKCFDFKARCLSTEDSIASLAEGADKEINLRDIYSKVKLDGNTDRTPEDDVVCRFCLELVKVNASTSVKHDIDIITMLQKYFLEMDLELTDDIIACTPCYSSLRLHVGFVNSYLSTEGKINEYYKVEGASYKDQVDLRNVAAFVSKSRLNVENSSLIIKEDKHENIVDTYVDVKVKLEDPMGVEQESKILVDKEIQQSNNNSFKHHPSLQSDCALQLPKAKQAKHSCETCEYQSSHIDSLQEHILAHKDMVQEVIYNCEICPFETNIKDYLKKHMLNHKGSSEVTLHKCAICSYQGKLRNLRAHMLTHKDDTEVTMYKCKVCEYKTKRKDNLNRHILIHKTQSVMYKCEACAYETKHKKYLQKHILIHLDVSVMEIHKCEVCPFETQWKRQLQEHLLAHRNPPDVAASVAIYKCYHCDYKAKQKANLKRHMLTHETHAEVTIYKCVVCNYETKWKSSLKKHILKHKSHSETTIYKCGTCDYVTKFKVNLEEHNRIHKDKWNIEMCKFEVHPLKTECSDSFGTPPDVVKPVTMYKCYHCAYEAKRKANLERHMLTHKTHSETTVYKCEVCNYATKWESSLKRHALTHTEATTYKCETCTYETKLKNNLQRHMLIHMDVSKIEIYKQVSKTIRTIKNNKFQ